MKKGEINKIKLSIILAFAFIFSTNYVSAMNIDFFYSPNCPACNSIFPEIILLSNQFTFPNYLWNGFDVSKKSYGINLIPTVRIETDDCREIELVGTNEINKYLKCELQEMSTPECRTHNYLKRGSYFIE